MISLHSEFGRETGSDMGADEEPEFRWVQRGDGVKCQGPRFFQADHLFNETCLCQRPVRLILIVQK